MIQGAVFCWFLWLMSTFVFAMTEDGSNFLDDTPTMTNIISNLSFLVAMVSLVLALVLSIGAFISGK